MARAGIFLTGKDIQTLTGFNLKAAYRHLKTIKDSLQLKKHQHLTITGYCRYEGCTEEEVYRKLNRKL